MHEVVPYKPVSATVVTCTVSYYLLKVYVVTDVVLVVAKVGELVMKHSPVVWNHFLTSWDRFVHGLFLVGGHLWAKLLIVLRLFLKAAVRAYCAVVRRWAVGRMAAIGLAMAADRCVA